jgi:hypothetical protein
VAAFADVNRAPQLLRPVYRSMHRSKGHAMSQDPILITDKRNIWLRGALMLLMALLFQLSGTLLFIVAALQFVFALSSEAPNARLLAFGRSLGRYLQQIVNFLTFASEALPFPFSDWPSGN